MQRLPASACAILSGGSTGSGQNTTRFRTIHRPTDLAPAHSISNFPPLRFTRVTLHLFERFCPVIAIISCGVLHRVLLAELTPKQLRLRKEIEDIASMVGMDHWNILNYKPSARTA
jgi:hypothetical protein